MYDKMGFMIRVECTTCDVPFFQLHRLLNKRHGSRPWQLAPWRKNICSLRDPGCLTSAATDLYLNFVSNIKDPSEGLETRRKVANRPQGWTRLAWLQPAR